MIFYEPPQFVVNDVPFYPEWTSDAHGNVVASPEKEGLILWQFDGGLFSSLNKPISDKEQFDALEQKLLAFCQDVLPSWQDRTLGIEVFSGNLDAVLSFPWNDLQEENYAEWKNLVDPANTVPAQLLRQHYACNILNEFIDLLTSGIPEQVEWFARVDASSVLDPVDFYQLTNKARYDHLHIFWKCPTPKMTVDLVWETGSPMQGYAAAHKKELSPLDSISTAWCLPPAWQIQPSILDQQKQLVAWLDENNISHRPVPEEKISLYWQGLDTIIAFGDQMTSQGRRQLAGFCAAGGTVVTVGPLLGLPNEESFATFSKHYATT